MPSAPKGDLVAHTIYLRQGLIEAIRRQAGGPKRAAEVIRRHLELLDGQPLPASTAIVASAFGVDTLSAADALAAAAALGMTPDELERGMTERAQTARTLRWAAQTLRRLAYDPRPPYAPTPSA